MTLLNNKVVVLLSLMILGITMLGCGSEPPLDEIVTSESRSQNAQLSTEIQAQESQEAAAQEADAQEHQTDQSSIDSTVIDISDEKPEISNDVLGQEFRVAITDIVDEELPVSGSFVEGDYQRDVLIVSPDEEVALMAGAVVSTGEGEENTVEIIVDDTTRIVHTAAETEWHVGDSDQLGAVLIELVEGEITVIDDGEGYFPMQINTPTGSVRLLGTWVLVSQVGDQLTVKCFRGPCQYLDERAQRVLVDEEKLEVSVDEELISEQMTEDDIKHFHDLPEVTTRSLPIPTIPDEVDYRGILHIFSSISEINRENWKSPYHDVSEIDLNWYEVGVNFGDDHVDDRLYLVKFRLPAVEGLQGPEFGSLQIELHGYPWDVHAHEHFYFDKHELHFLRMLQDRHPEWEAEYLRDARMPNRLSDGKIFFSVPNSRLVLNDGDMLQMFLSDGEYEVPLNSHRYATPARDIDERLERFLGKDTDVEWGNNTNLFEWRAGSRGSLRVNAPVLTSHVFSDGSLVIAEGEAYSVELHGSKGNLLSRARNYPTNSMFLTDLGLDQGAFVFTDYSRWVDFGEDVSLVVKKEDRVVYESSSKYADILGAKNDIYLETDPVDIVLGDWSGGETVNSFQPTLDWSASGPVDHYSIYVSHTSGQLEKVTDLTGTTHTVKTKELIPGEEYVWMVRAFSDADDEIGISNQGTFKVGFADIRDPLNDSLTQTLSSLGDNLKQVLYQERATREWFVYDEDHSFSLDVLSRAAPGIVPDSVGVISSIDNGQAVYINVANDAVFMGQNLYAGLNLVVWNP